MWHVVELAAVLYGPEDDTVEIINRRSLPAFPRRQLHFRSKVFGIDDLIRAACFTIYSNKKGIGRKIRGEYPGGQGGLIGHLFFRNNADLF